MKLRIYEDSLQLIRDMRGVVQAVSQHDPDLAKQMRRALSSIPLNIAEGEDERTAVRACIETADAFGYVDADAKLIDELDRIARTLNRLH